MNDFPLEILFILFNNLNHRDLLAVACASTILKAAVEKFRLTPAYRSKSVLSLFEDRNRQLVMLNNGRFIHKEIYRKHRDAKQRVGYHQHTVPEHAIFTPIYGNAGFYNVPLITDNCARCQYNHNQKPSGLFSLKRNLRYAISEQRKSDQDILLCGEEDKKPLYLHYSTQSLVYLHAIIIACKQDHLHAFNITDHHLTKYEMTFYDIEQLSFRDKETHISFEFKLQTMMKTLRDINPKLHDECQMFGRQLLDEIGYVNKSIRQIK